MKILSTGAIITLLLSVAFLSFKGISKPIPEGSATVNWMTFEEAIEKNKQHPKKIFIDVYTAWCGWCKVMDKQTFTNPIIADYINSKYYPVKFDAEQKDTLHFNNKDYVFVQNGRRGYHELAAELLKGRMSYPSIVFLDEKANLIQTIPGFRKPPELDIMLKYFGGNYYQKTKYETFTKEYVSPFEKDGH